MMLKDEEKMMEFNIKFNFDKNIPSANKEECTLFLYIWESEIKARPNQLKIESIKLLTRLIATTEGLQTQLFGHQ